MALGSTACPADHTSPAVRPLLAPGIRHGCRVHAVPATWMWHPHRIRGAGARGEPESPVTGILWERRGTNGTRATAAAGSPRNPSHPARQGCAPQVASRRGLRTWPPAGPAAGRSRAPSPRRRLSAPPGPPNPRSCGRRRAGRWPRPRAGERTRRSNTPSKIISSTPPAGVLWKAGLSTAVHPVSVDKYC